MVLVTRVKLTLVQRKHKVQFNLLWAALLKRWKEGEKGGRKDKGKETKKEGQKKGRRERKTK